MRLRSHLRRLLPANILAFMASDHIEQFSFDKSGDVRSDIQVKYGFDGDLLDIYVNTKNGMVHKWHHYIPIYDRHFSNFRGSGVRLLEIGVSEGGSLEMWRSYFGEDAKIFGVDVDPRCSRFDGFAGQVRIGSQADSVFMESVIDEMGGVDVIVDDGSHQMSDVLKTLRTLFPSLSVGGIYVIEDLHTAYWRSYGGGYRSRSNFFRVLGDLIDDMHHWYHSSNVKFPSIADTCSAIHIYDSMVVLEKSAIHEPKHSHIP